MGFTGCWAWTREAKRRREEQKLAIIIICFIKSEKMRISAAKVVIFFGDSKNFHTFVPPLIKTNEK
jgi:hypothetical protein